MEGKTILVEDAHSKWIKATIKVLRNLFATHGIFQLDTGTSFTGKEFKEFMTKNGICHRTSASYHPATNGLVERAVQLLEKDCVRTQKVHWNLALPE